MIAIDDFETLRRKVLQARRPQARQEVEVPQARRPSESESPFRQEDLGVWKLSVWKKSLQARRPQARQEVEVPQARRP